MNIRFKIASTVMSMCLALAVMGFAVWAASTQTLPVTNTVDFTSIHVLSTVSGTVTGAEEGTFTNYGPVSTLAGDEEGKLETWAIGSALEFANETEPVVVTLTIVNNSDERALSFELSGQAYEAFNGTNLGDTNIDRTCVYSINNATPVTNATYTSGAISIESLKTATIVMTLDISDNGKSVTGFNNSFSMTLRNVGETTESFSFNPETKILTLGEGITLTEENLPEMIVEGEPAYYGLYEDASYTQQIELPYSGATTLYAKFDNPTNMTFTLINDDSEYSVEKNISELPTGAIEIPTEYNGKIVSTIPADAFSSCTGITSMKIPVSVTTIGRALVGCTGITSLEAPLSSPYNMATNSYLRYYFGGTSYSAGGTVPTSLKTFVISKGVTAIGNYATRSCSSLTNITIPSSVTSIGTYAFYGCSGLTSIEIPSNVTTILMSTFRNCTGLTNITIPNGVTYIDSSAFYGCTGFTSIIIPSSVTSIGTGVFSGCTALASITIPDSLVSIGSTAFDNTSWYINQPDGLVYAGKVAYKYKGIMPESTSITLLSDTKGIAGNAFASFVNLLGIEIPSNVTNIGVSAFSGCTGLTSVTIPNSVTSIGDSAFMNCTGITSIATSDSSIITIGILAFYGCTGLTNFVIPNSVTTIKSQAFDSCTGLTSVTIPNSVITIESSVFSDCIGLTSVIIPNSVTTIGMSIFSGCTGLTEITISNSLTTISQNAFSGCTGILGVTIPSSVTTIGDDAFNGCISLISVTIPSSVTSIGYRVFSNCTGLTSATIQNSVVANTAFSGCTSLTNVNISSNVTSIEICAFYGCSALASISIPSSVTSLMTSAFYDCASLINVTIDSSTIASELTSSSACEYLINYMVTGSELFILDSIETIGSYVTDTANFNAPVVVDIGGVNYKKFIKV
ncbi:MAG: leucine-rich repeat domain-containing protein [Clostridia bacterium]